MSDESVREALRSPAPLVVVEAPAGCGKTHQGAEYAIDAAAASGPGRVLVLTHTHAACSVFAARTREARIRCDVRTIDSFLAEVAAAYHPGLGLPADISGWVRDRRNGYAEVAQKVAILLSRHPMISAALAQRYPVVLCDEHQDSSGDQHAAVMALQRGGARVRIFADPMQRVFRTQPLVGSNIAWNWTELTHKAQAFECLDSPHRWRHGCHALGALTLRWRAALKMGGKLDLAGQLPPSVTVVRAENVAQRNLEYRVAKCDRREIDAFERTQHSLLVMTRFNDTARSIRSFFFRRIPIWEGHTRTALDTLVRAILSATGDRVKLANAVVRFLSEVAKGFSPSQFGRAFEAEVRDGCSSKRRGQPAAIQELARFLVEEPDHRGVAKMLNRAHELREQGERFRDVELDLAQEYRDAMRLGDFDTAATGHAEIARRRTYSYLRPPPRAISTIHKAKGLECDSAIVLPCDAKNFPDSEESRCLLYVALSRAMKRLVIVVPPSNPSPLMIV